MELTCEIWDVDGIKKHTVKLSRKNVDQLEKIFDDIKTELERTEKPRESALIFRHVILLLDQYGLLPDDVSVEEAQRLVTRGYLDGGTIKLFEKKHVRGLIDENENMFCLIAGRTNKTYFEGHGARFFWKLTEFTIRLYKWAVENNHTWLAKLLNQTILLVFLFYAYVGSTIFTLIINPLSMIHTVGLGFKQAGEEPFVEPACGWIHTIGINGVKKWNGSFYGHLALPPINFLFNDSFYPGIVGFTGIKIVSNLTTLNYTYFGSAFHVKIDSAPPE
ncbi:MAG: hypothetical protein DRN08_02730 [Thermoplasmata archaeon]|nr:MAG: hypothetical protein DRN08_02730 [Thermoplasmata archaeon]